MEMKKGEEKKRAEKLAKLVRQKLKEAGEKVAFVVYMLG